MAHSEELADRVRELIFERAEVTEKKMFGGIAWMLSGNMAVATFGEDLLVRLPKEDVEATLNEPDIGPMEMKGRRMGGFVVVGAVRLVEDDGELAEWVDTGASYAQSLPAK